jgi:hypothetical protein
MKTVIRLLPLIFSLALYTGCPSVSGQYYFGKNKIQYSRLDWKVLQTEHFNVYYHSGEEYLSEIAAHSIETSCKFLEDKFNMPLLDRVPVIIYSAPNYFNQTNVIPQILPENVAGFTEYFKGRVVVPFDGSYFNFNRVLRHELVHVFTDKKLEQVNRDHKRLKFFSLPLWFTEGIAEYWSGEWSSSGDMILSDAVLSGQFLDERSINSIAGSYQMYKVGESILHHMADTYGEEKILLLFENWWKANSFEGVIQYTFGVPLSEIFLSWQYSMKKRYFPTVETAEDPMRCAELLTPDGFSVKPEVVRLNLNDESERDYLIYKANKLGYSGIYMQESAGGKSRSVTLVKGERSPKFESLHLFDSDISVSRQGKLAFSSRRFERDVLYIYDLRTRKLERTIDFEHLLLVQSPSWSRDGSQILFSGCDKRGEYNLFVFKPAEDSLRQLVDDIYYDADAVFSPDGLSAVFSSDRTADGDSGSRNLFSMNLATGAIQQITWGRFVDGGPSFSPDGMWIVFQSNRGGMNGIHLLDSLGNMFRFGSLSADIQDPSFTPSGDSLVFAAYSGSTYKIFKIEFDDSLLVQVDNTPIPHIAWRPPAYSGDSEQSRYDYHNEFSFDIAQSAVAYDAFYGTLGGFQVALSDMLGNHRYHFLLYNTATNRSDFLSSFNVGVTYINLAGRFTWAAGAFHLYDEYYNRIDGDYDERQYGGIGLISYPLSKFRRIELTSVLRKSERIYFPSDFTRHAVLSTNYLSYVVDNSLWDISGPIDGTRLNFTAGVALDLKSGKSFTHIGMADIRKYIRLGRRSAFATRILGYSSGGQEPQRLYLGGSWSLRGYDRRTFYGRNLVLLSNELRFPLIDDLYMRFPLGRIGFSGIRGAIFYDNGNAWDDDFSRFYGAFGVGARVALGYVALLRFDLSRTTDYIKLSPNWKFDFFFGWNF